MRRFLFTSLITGCLFASATANIGCGCCVEFDPFIEGRVLFLRPCTEGTYYTVLDGASSVDYNSSKGYCPKGSQKNNSPDYSTGFELGIGARLCNCSELAIRWERINTTDCDTTTVAGHDTLWITRGHPDQAASSLQDGFASSQLEFCWNAVDLDAYWCMQNSCCYNVYMRCGLRWAELDFDETIHYQGDFERGELESLRIGSIDIDLKSHVWGVGPRVGFGGAYNFCGCLSFEGEVHGSVLIGEMHGHSFTGDTFYADSGVNVNNECICNFLPGLGFRAGFAYAFCNECLHMKIEGGYRADRYFDAVQRTFWADESRNGINLVGNTNFDLSGFYVGAQINF
ncbi:MAG: hypothetical protein S4CHLAM123_11330 [Chlamydiales bacterium]|nr:hypothetical protein [Chlamydiales bacterium]